jgi:hypothetical protein
MSHRQSTRLCHHLINCYNASTSHYNASRIWLIYQKNDQTVKTLLCKAFNALMNRYNDSRNRYNDSLEHIDLSENSQSVANVLQNIQHFCESYNDLRNRYNDSLECIDLSEDGQSVANVFAKCSML